MVKILSIIILASIISGETGEICPIEAKIAIARIHSQNKVFYGYNANFSGIDLLISANWEKAEDTSRGAKFIFSDDDLKQKRVQELVKDKKLKAKFQCKNGLNLYAY